MKVLIPACNMESRLRNKYLFFFTELADIRPFLWVCAGAGGVGGLAGVHPCVWDVWVLSGVLALGGGCVVHLYTQGTCVCAHPRRSRVCRRAMEGACISLCRWSTYSCGRAHLAACVYLRGSESALRRSHPLAGRVPFCTQDPRGTRAPAPCPLAGVFACPRVFAATSSAPHGDNPPCRTAVRSDTCVSVPRGSV